MYRRGDRVLYKGEECEVEETVLLDNILYCWLGMIHKWVESYKLVSLG